jgi:16S rRNA (uracil1498-N3)-methyltransferase
MHRFYVPQADSGQRQIELPEREAHHAATVLRVRPGEKVSVLNGRGLELNGFISQAARRSISITIESRIQHPPSPCPITLFQAVLKGKAMDWVMQKSTELGVHRIVPVLTGRTIPVVDGSDGPSKALKWTSTAVEALKQCGSPWLPIIEPPLAFEAALRTSEETELILIAALDEKVRLACDFLDAHRKQTGRAPSSIGVWIGPEGDFTPGELKCLAASGGGSMTLGPRVLRSDTAALASVAILQYELLPQFR